MSKSSRSLKNGLSRRGGRAGTARLVALGVLACFDPRWPVLLKLQSAAVQQSGLVCGMAIDPSDYYVITSRRGEHPDRWSWEIRRKSKPLGIKMTGDGYQSDTVAQFAGHQALADFLSELSKEEKRPRK